MSRWVFAAVLVCAAPAFADARFFAAFDDVPLAPGLSETAAGFVFDGEQGRIVQAEAIGAGAPGAIRSFYMDTLPALGWSYSPSGEDSLVFLRGRERLTLDVSPTDAGAHLTARLVQRPASMARD